MGLPDRTRNLTISSAVWIQYTNVINGQTDGRLQSIASRGKKLTATLKLKIRISNHRLTCIDSIFNSPPSVGRIFVSGFDMPKAVSIRFRSVLVASLCWLSACSFRHKNDWCATASIPQGGENVYPAWLLWFGSCQLDNVRYRKRPDTAPRRRLGTRDFLKMLAGECRTATLGTCDQFPARLG